MSNAVTICSLSGSQSKEIMTDILLKNGLSMIVGDMHALNCSVANDISSCLVTGKPWFGKEVCTLGSVLYIGTYGLGKAVENALSLGRKHFTDQISVTDESINLLNEQQVIDLVKQLNKPDGLIRKGLSLIVIELSSYKFEDTLQLTNVAKVVKNLNYILENTGVSVLLVEADGSTRRQGGRVLLGMADVVINVKYDHYSHNNNDIDIACTKANDVFLTPPIKFGRMKHRNVGEQS